MRSCPGASDEEKMSFARQKIVNIVRINSEKSTDVTDIPSAKSCNVKPSNNLSKFVDSLKLSEESIIDLKIAKFILRTGSAFRVIESESFREMIQALRPAYATKIKSSSTLRGPLLDKIFKQVREKTVNKIQNSSGYVLISDGMTDVASHHIVNFIVIVPGEKPFFYKSVDVGDTP